MWIYVFIASVISMQLVEFFIWRNIDNAYYNHLFSIMAFLLLILQPAASLMILTNISLRNMLLFVYLLGAIPFSAYNIATNPQIRSTISKKGHLQWKFLSVIPIYPPIIWLFYLFFILFAFVYEGKWFGFLLGTILLIISYINYGSDQSVNSMWCWGINSFLLFYLVYLLIVLPFYEKAGLC
jgi:hypothetical protein